MKRKKAVSWEAPKKRKVRRRVTPTAPADGSSPLLDMITVFIDVMRDALDETDWVILRHVNKALRASTPVSDLSLAHALMICGTRAALDEFFEMTTRPPGRFEVFRAFVSRPRNGHGLNYWIKRFGYEVFYFSRTDDDFCSYCMQNLHETSGLELLSEFIHFTSYLDDHVVELATLGTRAVQETCDTLDLDTWSHAKTAYKNRDFELCEKILRIDPSEVEELYKLPGPEAARIFVNLGATLDCMYDILNGALESCWLRAFLEKGGKYRSAVDDVLEEWHRDFINEPEEFEESFDEPIRDVLLEFGLI
jgi:hypothetical protein